MAIKLRWHAHCSFTDMKRPFRRLCGLVALVLFTSVPCSVSASTLTFDDLPPTGSFSSIPSGYGGLNWSSDFWYINRNLHPGSGYDLGTVSGEYSAFNAFDSEVSVDNGTFTFDSAYFASAWDASQTLHVEGWLAGSQVYVADHTIVNTGPTFYTFNWTVDEVRFDSSGTQFVMDDMTINTGAVPDGGSILTLLGLALGFVGVARRFLRK